MRYFVAIVFVGALAILLFMLPKKHQNVFSVRRSGVDLQTLHFNPETPNDHTQFERLIGDLLLVPMGDFIDLGPGLQFKFDINSRKKYFTNDAWNQYQVFVEKLRNNRIKKSTNFHVRGRIKAGSQSYKKLRDIATEFTATGLFCQGGGDVEGCSDKDIFKLQLSYTNWHAGKTPELVIDSWSVIPPM